MTDMDDDKKMYEGWPDPPAADEQGEAEIEPEDMPTVEAGVDELAAVTAERDEYLDQLQRSRAEFANFRRRNEQERQVLRTIVQRDVLAQFLPVIDDFDRAMDAVPDDDRDSGWVQGITMIQNKLHGILERAGITEIEALHQPFDPAVHEAVATEPDSKHNVVVEVYQKGYRLGDFLLRPAMVKTGDAPEAQEETSFDA